MKGEKIFSGLELDYLELTLQERLKLIKFFEFLLDEEISKPLGQMNSEAVDNYIEILLHLKGINIELSSEFIHEQVRKIFHPEESAVPETAKTTKKHFNKKKIWLVAACISILVALFSVISFSSEKGIVDTLEEFFGTFEFIPSGKETDIGNETYGKSEERKVYKSVEDLVKKEQIDILCPSKEVCVINHISVGKINGDTIVGVAFEKSRLLMNITINSEIPQEAIDVCNKKITLNGTDYYLCIMEDVNQVQAHFMHNNNMYFIMHTDEEKLLEILNNMEEIKYED